MCLIRNIIFLFRKPYINPIQFVQYSTANVNVEPKSIFKMQGWQIHSYGDISELQFTDSARIPIINSPDGIIVDVISSSINPIDVAMTSGYGSALLGMLRRFSSCQFNNTVEFPLTLGRDFVGTVSQKGYSVGKNLNIGDDVWGVVPAHEQGAHAEKVMVKSSWVCKKPRNLNVIEAGSIPYVAMTAWSALKYTGDFFILPASHKHVLILGASGGVGTVALQLLKAWGATVVATCSEDAIPLVESFGADAVINYKAPDASKRIHDEGKYDVIMDTAGLGSDHGQNYQNCLKVWNLSKYITLKSPLLRNFDMYGFFGGIGKNAFDLLIPNIKMLTSNFSSTVRWGFFYPSHEGLQEITRLVEAGKIVPAVEKVYPFSELPAAYERVKSGHLRGKIVIQVKEDDNVQER